MKKMTEIRYYDSELEGATWAPLQVAETMIEENGRNIFLAASPAGVDNVWGFWVSSESIVSQLETDSHAEFVKLIEKRYESLKALLDSEYLKEFIYLMCKANEEFGIEFVNIDQI